MSSSSQFSSLNTALNPSHTLTHSLLYSDIYLSLLILVSGDTKSYPEPVSLVSFNMSTLFLTKLILITLMSLLLLKLGLFKTLPLLNYPRGFTFINTPRPVPDSCTSSIVGRGTTFLLLEPCDPLFTRNLLLYDSKSIFNWILNSCFHSEDLHQILWFRAALRWETINCVSYTV